MRNLITAAVLAAAALAGSAEAAAAHTWYLANRHFGRCELTTWTPQVYSYMMGAGKIPDKNVYKDSNGIIGVMVEWGHRQIDLVLYRHEGVRSQEPIS
jgi:hypothetical protein